MENWKSMKNWGILYTLKRNEEKKMTETENMAGLLWDLYKEAFGVRPRHVTEAQWADLEYLKGLYAVCLDVLEAQG